MAKRNFIQWLLLNTLNTSYTYMGRLFMRLFVGIMFMQFGIRQWVNYDALVDTFPTALGLDSQTCLILMIIIEMVCSPLIILGLFTRLSTIPAIVSMIAAEIYLLFDLLPADQAIAGLTFADPGYLPIMFIGFFITILLSGPGKISVDYLLALRILDPEGGETHDEVLDV